MGVTSNSKQQKITIIKTESENGKDEYSKESALAIDFAIDDEKETHDKNANNQSNKPALSLMNTSSNFSQSSPKPSDSMLSLKQLQISPSKSYLAEKAFSKYLVSFTKQAMENRMSTEFRITSFE